MMNTALQTRTRDPRVLLNGLALRVPRLIRENGFVVDPELWGRDEAECSPCDDKVPDSH